MFGSKQTNVTAFITEFAKPHNDAKTEIQFIV